MLELSAFEKKEKKLIVSEKEIYLYIKELYPFGLYMSTYDAEKRCYFKSRMLFNMVLISKK